MSVRPFKIDIPQTKIDRLKAKLAAADFPDELDDSGWEYGAPLEDIKRIATYWRDQFDWRKAEAELNEMPQFMTTIKVDGYDPIDLHFVHVKSQVPGAIPLLFAHGWPGSFDEVQKLLPLLTKGDDDHPSFDVIAPSMPNYGFSSGIKKKGFGARQIAEIYNKLMTEVLGYTEYVTQGGDIGYGITRIMGFLFPQHCRASHYNFPRCNPPSIDKFPDLFVQDQQTPRTQAELEGFERCKWFQKEGRGYQQIQSTKPQTLGYGLTDSPVGLMAWIYEKLHDWTDSYPWTEYEVCKWISIYWFSTSGPTATLRIYYESVHANDPLRQSAGADYLEGVKIGVTKFPKELYVFPALWNKTLGNLVFEKTYPHGGHFAAFEKPDELASDLREMFGKKGGAYAVVKGKTGY